MRLCFSLGPMSAFLLLALASFGLPTTPLATLSAAPGEVLRASLVWPAGGGLLSREAPSRLTLLTPWGKVSAQPTGTRPDAEYAGYYAAVQPTELRLKVPAGQRPGTYDAQLQADLFMCDQADKICTRRQLDWPVKLRVVAGKAPGPQTVKLRPADLRGKTLRPR